jgi:hypothetical protein
VARRVTLAVVALVAGAVCWPAGVGWAGPLATTGTSSPPLESMVLSQPLPGFVAALAGPTNGSLTATEFASQSADPQQATSQFAALASQNGFGAYIRLWTDREGSAAGANDLAILLFRIPDGPDAEAFAAGLRNPFESSRAIESFAVPSVPGARGYSVQVATPVHATEQVVVFGAGHYVSMIQLASTTSTSNPSPLTSSQAITLTYQQYRLLRQGDPVGAASVSAHTKPAKVAAPSVAVRSSGISPAVLVVVVLVVLLALAVGVMAVGRRRHRAEAAGSAGDPWGPDGILAAVGAVDPRELAVEDGGVRGPRPVPSVVPAVEPAAVPAIGPAPVSDEVADAAGTPEPSRS